LAPLIGWIVADDESESETTMVYRDDEITEVKRMTEESREDE
jgi:hypothetical protein